MRAKLKIEHGVELPDGGRHHGLLEEIYAPVFSKMKKGDSIPFENGKELNRAFQYATRYSRRYKKNAWRFRTSQVGECRMWRIA